MQFLTPDVNISRTFELAGEERKKQCIIKSACFLIIKFVNISKWEKNLLRGKKQKKKKKVKEYIISLASQIPIKLQIHK